jgi:lipopolysaccharide export LptBFGC system permease protein LptF
MKQFYLILLLLFISILSRAQTKSGEVMTDSILNKAAITNGRRQLLLMIEREQKKADVSDGVFDKRLDIDEDTSKSNALSITLFKKVGVTVSYIENNETDDMIKRRYLGRIIENLKTFNADMNDSYVDIAYYVTLFENTYQVLRGMHNRNLANYVKDHISQSM